MQSFYTVSHYFLFISENRQTLDQHNDIKSSRKERWHLEDGISEERKNDNLFIPHLTHP